MSPIRMLVPGVPAQQGSKTRWLTEENPHVKGWRQAVAENAQTILRETPPLGGPVKVIADFVFPRPKSHFRGRDSDILRDDAPLHHTSFPDLDKLQRAIGDALSSVVIRDDRQIAEWHVRKVYGVRPCARIVVVPLQRISA